jgi:dihydrofolate reductase
MPEGDPFGDVMNAIPKYVVSTTLTDVSAWRNSTLIKDNVVEQVCALIAQPGKHILIDGSSVLVHTLAQNDLVDEYSLLVFPLVLGGGKRLFPDGLRASLRLVETRSFPTGVVLMRYAAERPTSGGEHDG